MSVQEGQRYHESIADLVSSLGLSDNRDDRVTGQLLDEVLLSGRYITFGLGGGEEKNPPGQQVLKALKILFFDQGKIMETLSFFGKDIDIRRTLDEKKIQSFLEQTESDLVKVPKAYRDSYIRTVADLGSRVICAVGLYEDPETHDESFQVHLLEALVHSHVSQINLIEPIVSAGLGLMCEHGGHSNLQDETIIELSVNPSLAQEKTNASGPREALKKGLLDKAPLLLNRDFSAEEISDFLEFDYRPWEDMLEGKSTKSMRMGLHRLPEGNESKKVVVIKREPIEPDKSPDFVVLVKHGKTDQPILVFNKDGTFRYMRIGEIVTGPRDANIEDLKVMNSTLARLFLRQGQ